MRATSILVLSSLSSPSFSSRPSFLVSSLCCPCFSSLSSSSFFFCVFGVRHGGTKERVIGRLSCGVLLTMVMNGAWCFFGIL